MSSTQRNQSALDKQAKDRNSTQLLEKILLSSSSSSSQKKIQSIGDPNKIILQTHDNNSVGGGQHTYRGGAFNNTGKNWRKLITPAQDSFKKMQQQQPEYSGYNAGSRATTQNDRPIGATTNSHNTSMDTGNYSSVKEFSPSNEIKQLKMTIRGENAHNQQSKISHQIEHESKSMDLQKSKISNNLSTLRSHLHVIPDEESKTFKQSQMGEFGTTSIQMKSLMKSFSNGNFQFYENLHKKYFDKAKDKSQKFSKPPTASNLGFDKSDKDLFTLTSKTGTMLGLSQFKSSLDSYSGANDDKPSVLRASSLQGKKSQINQKEKNAMSINFKNSLYKKMNPTVALLDDNSQSQINNEKSKILHDRSLHDKISRRHDYFDSSSSSDLDLDDKPEESKSEEKKQAIDIQQHIMKRQIEILGGSKRGNSQTNKRQSLERESKDTFEEELFNKDKNGLSRRDLSTRQDDTASLIATPENHYMEQQRKNKFHRDVNQLNIPKSKSNQNRQIETKIHPPPIFDSQASPNLFQGLRSLSSSDIQHQNQKNPSSQSSQPTKEDALEDTYNNVHMMNQNKQQRECDDLRAEDLTTMIDQVCMSQMQSSQISNNDDILKTYQEHVKMARTKLNQVEEFPLQKKHFNSHQNSIYNNIPSEKQNVAKNPVNCFSSAAPPRQRHFIGQSMKNSNMKEEQKSDFTFVLSNPTDFQFDCNCNLENSFITNKHAMLPKGGPKSNTQNSDLKSQQDQTSSYRKNNLLRNKLQDIAASPIYSEGGGLPTQYYPTQMNQCCPNCGGGKMNALPQLQHQRNSNPVQTRLSYTNNNHFNQHSIKEESQMDEDDNETQNQNNHQYSNQETSPPVINASSDQPSLNNNTYYPYFNGDSEQQQHVRVQNQYMQVQQNVNKTVFEYGQVNQRKDREIISGETSLEHNLNDNQKTNQSTSATQDDEVKLLRFILSFSYEYMAKMLQEGSLSNDMKSELTKVLGLLSNANSVQSLSVNNPSVYFQKPNGHTKSNNALWNMISQQTTIQQLDHGDNMTMSELLHHNNQKQQLKYQNIKVVQDQQSPNNESSLQVLQESALDNDDHHQIQGEFEKIPKVSPIYPVRRKKNDKKHYPLKSSLISDQGSIPGSNLKETVYSYFDHDDDIDDSQEDEDDEDFDDHDQRQKQNRFSYLKDQSNKLKQSSREDRCLKRSKMQGTPGVGKINDLKKSLRKTKKSLQKAKQYLQRERQMNRQQEDKLLKLQAEIEALNQRWLITEERIKSGENMYQLMQRTTQIIHNTTTTNTTATGHNNSNSNNKTLKDQHFSSFKIGQQSSNSFLIRDSSPLPINTSNNVSQHTLQNAQSHNILNQQSQATNLTTTVVGSTGPITLNSNSANVNNPILDNSSKHLLDINDRLTRQIEDNINLFENLNNELTQKEQALMLNQHLLQEKNQEVEILKQKIKDMNENMRNLVDVTKSTTEATEQSKIKHIEEMERLRKRQEEYQKKIEKIQSVFQPINDISGFLESNENQNMMNNSSAQSSHGKALYSKYSSKRQMNAATKVLNCIPLTSPGSAQGTIPVHYHNDSSHIQDEEFSIGQIQRDGAYQGYSQHQNDISTSDFMPTKLTTNGKQQMQQQEDHLNNKENTNPFSNNHGQDLSLLNSNMLQSLYNNLKDSVKNYHNMQQSSIGHNTTNVIFHQNNNNYPQKNPSSFMNTDESSTMLKYSHDNTHSFQNTLKGTKRFN